MHHLLLLRLSEATPLLAQISNSQPLLRTKCAVANVAKRPEGSWIFLKLVRLIKGKPYVLYIQLSLLTGGLEQKTGGISMHYRVTRQL